MKSDKIRHILKTISYRLFSLIATFVISFLLTGSILVSLSISSIELIIKSILYYVHERIWYKKIRIKNEKN